MEAELMKPEFCVYKEFPMQVSFCLLGSEYDPNQLLSLLLQHVLSASLSTEDQ